MNQAEESNVYDVVKVITTLLVVIAHATRMYTPTGVFEPVNKSVVLDFLTEYIYKFHMPLFVFITGCVYGCCISCGKYKDKKAFLVNKAKRLLIPYLFCGFFCVAPVMQILRLDTQGYIKYCFFGIVLSKNSRHLWYILALFWIFVLAMLVRSYFDVGEKGAVVVGIVSTVLFLVAYKLPAVFQIQEACNYQIYFLAGVGFHYAYRKSVPFLKRLRKLTIVLPFVLMLAFVCNPNRISKMGYACVGILMILILAYWIVEKRSDLLDKAVYRWMRKNSFAIYLFHPMLIYVFFYMLEDYDINPFLLSGGVSLASIVLSAFAAGVLRKLHLGLLIGE